MVFFSQIRSVYTHVLREENLVVDALAKNGQSVALFSSHWWDSTPSFVNSFLSRDSLGLHFSRVYIN